MNTFEKNQIRDSVLNGGLVVALVLWVAIAAARGPLPLTSPQAGASAAAVAAPAHDVATAPARADIRRNT